MDVHGHAGGRTRSAHQQEHSDKRREPAPNLRFSAQPRAGNSQTFLLTIHTDLLSLPTAAPDLSNHTRSGKIKAPQSARDSVSQPFEKMVGLGRVELPTFGVAIEPSKRERQLNPQDCRVSTFVAVLLPQILAMWRDRQIAGMPPLIIQLQSFLCVCRLGIFTRLDPNQPH
jgi:hypothetical protein